MHRIEDQRLTERAFRKLISKSQISVDSLILLLFELLTSIRNSNFIIVVDVKDLVSKSITDRDLGPSYLNSLRFKLGLSVLFEFVVFRILYSSFQLDSLIFQWLKPRSTITNLKFSRESHTLTCRVISTLVSVIDFAKINLLDLIIFH